MAKTGSLKEFLQLGRDLIISRILVEIFSADFLRENLAFRCCKAFHKLYLHPASGYSEDIDLIQITEGPIKPIKKRIGEVITFFEEDTHPGKGARSKGFISVLLQNMKKIRNQADLRK